jgi:hypothetical protein
MFTELDRIVKDRIWNLPAFKISEDKKRILYDTAFILIDDNAKYKRIIYKHIFKKAEKGSFNINILGKLYIFCNLISLRTKLLCLSPFMFLILGKAFLLKNTLFFALIGIIFLLLFILFSLLVYEILYYQFSKINNLIEYLNHTQKEVNSYISDFLGEISRIESKDYDLSDIGNKISKQFIKIEISKLSFREKGIHLFELVMGFLLSVFVLYMLGDLSVISIQKIASVLHLEKISFVKNLSLENVFLILFPLFITIVRDLAIRACANRSRDLHKSLAILETLYPDKV